MRSLLLPSLTLGLALFLLELPEPRVAQAAPPEDPMGTIREELGVATPVVREGPFVLAGPGWTAGSLQSVATLVRQALDALYADRFTTTPARPVAVYLFPSAQPYERFCRTRLGDPCMSPFGFYRPDFRTIVMNAGPGLGTLTHEMIHPLMEADFASAPTWIDEGIASLFEAPVIPRHGEIHGVKNWRLPRLQSALRSSREAAITRLDALFGMNDASFRDGDESLHYAMARYVCQWLDAQGKLWPFYRAWRDDVANDPTGEKAFSRVIGEAPRDANDAWVEWVRRL
jgi:hypothetical protein